MQRGTREEETSTRVLGLNPRPIYEKTELAYAVSSYFFWATRILPLLLTPTRKKHLTSTFFSSSSLLEKATEKTTATAKVIENEE